MSVLRNLTGAQRDAGAALLQLFEQFDLGSLAPKLVQYLQEGLDGDSIYVLLQDTSEWKDRFKANERRKKMGLSVLTPQEYIAAERGYRRALQAAGIPSGMWDSREDFTQFLVQDISPDEIAERAQSARALADSVDIQQKRALARRGIDVGALAAYYLNPKKAMPELQKRVDVAMLDAERTRAGFGASRARAEELYSLGVDIDTARAGYSAISSALPAAETLSGTRGAIANVNQRTLEREVFQQSPEAARRRRRLESQERARFGGSGGTGADTYTRDRRFN